MSFPRSIIKSTDLSNTQIDDLFSFADQEKNRTNKISMNKIAVLFFLENSTRTISSFEIAAHQIGITTTKFMIQQSSLEKGETVSDTILNLMAMNPDFFIFRASDNLKIDEIQKNVTELLHRNKTLWINGGLGTVEHPTQCYLDLYTMKSELGRWPAKVLFVGDVKHSRVFHSHLHLLTRFGVEVQTCGPLEFRSLHCQNHTDRFDTEVETAEVIVMLRAQFERHHTKIVKSEEEYFQNFGMTSARLKKLKKEQILLHPGPVNYSVEISEDVHQYSQSRIMKQVENGVLIRKALMQKMIGASIE